MATPTQPVSNPQPAPTTVSPKPSQLPPPGPSNIVVRTPNPLPPPRTVGSQ